MIWYHAVGKINGILTIESVSCMTSASSNNDTLQLQQRIAELERTLEETQQRTLLLQALLDGIPSVIYATDLEGRIQVINQAFAYWVGFNSSDIIGKYQLDLFPPDLVAYWQSQVDTVLATGETFTKEETVPGADGTQSFLSQRFALRNEQGEITAIAGTAVDITDRKNIENALRDNQRLMRAIIDNAPSVIYVKSPEGKMIVVNQLYAKIFDRSIDDIVGTNESDMFPEEWVDQWQEDDKRLFAGGKPAQYSQVMYLNNEPHDFLTTHFPLYDEQGEPFAICGIATDVTELRQAEQERTRLQEEIIAAQQAALRELSTPLIPISEGVLVMPLIGTMDSNRARQVMETLLTGVTHNRATSVILDITGLPVVDTQVANVLIQATVAARLLGAEVILTGIGPEVAQTLISLGTDLQGITTPGTLQSGIAYVLRRRAALTA